MATSLMSVFGAGLDTVLEVLLLNAAGVILAWYPIPEGLTATASVRSKQNVHVQGVGWPAPPACWRLCPSTHQIVKQQLGAPGMWTCMSTSVCTCDFLVDWFLYVCRCLCWRKCGGVSKWNLCLWCLWCPPYLLIHSATTP
jgi:hypothetical protein